MERVVTLDVSQGTATGTVLLDLEIHPGVTKRYSRMASTFQRVRYEGVRLHISAKGPSTSGGGYLVAFVADITDHPSIENLGSFQGARTRKFWEDTDVPAMIANDLYYTSPDVLDEAGQDRWWSPGKYVVMVDGAPNTNVSLTFHITLTAHLSIPSLEKEEKTDVGTSVILKNLRFKAGAHTLESLDTPAQENPNQLIAPIPQDTPVIYKVPPFIMEYAEGEGDTGTIEFQYLYVTTTHIGVSMDGVTNYTAQNQQGNITANARSIVVVENQVVRPYDRNAIRLEAVKSRFIETNLRR